MPQKVRVAGRYYVPEADCGVGALLTAASWVVQRLPGEVVERHRAECVQALARAEMITIQVIPTIGVRVSTGDRLLVDLPRPTDVPQARDQASGRWAAAQVAKAAEAP